MSYSDMDHAAWAERNNAAGRRSAKRPKTDKYGRRLGFHAAPETLTAFQAKVMDIIGMVYGGIYNAPITWDTIDWDCGGGVSVVASSSGGLATFDYSRMTMLVLLCHVARIRGDVSAAGPSNFRLSFWQRGAEGGVSRRHPDIAEAVATFEEYLPANHRVRWREPESVSQTAE